ncbi:MAG TPA: STAS domain-containing protein [Jiangellales bacterium]|nr:STAS domain-containing protein [Jiangellales bacterium]
MDVTDDLDSGVLRLTGSLDVRSVAAVREALAGLLDRLPGDVVLDLSGVDVVDATGLGVIVAAHRRALRSGRRLVLRGVEPGLARLFAIARLARVLSFERAGDAR